MTKLADPGSSTPTHGGARPAPDRKPAGTPETRLLRRLFRRRSSGALSFAAKVSISLPVTSTIFLWSVGSQAGVDELLDATVLWLCVWAVLTSIGVACFPLRRSWAAVVLGFVLILPSACLLGLVKSELPGYMRPPDLPEQFACDAPGGQYAMAAFDLDDDSVRLDGVISNPIGAEDPSWAPLLKVGISHSERGSRFFGLRATLNEDGDAFVLRSVYHTSRKKSHPGRRVGQPLGALRPGESLPFEIRWRSDGLAIVRVGERVDSLWLGFKPRRANLSCSTASVMFRDLTTHPAELRRRNTQLLLDASPTDFEVSRSDFWEKRWEDAHVCEVSGIGDRLVLGAHFRLLEEGRARFGIDLVNCTDGILELGDGEEGTRLWLEAREETGDWERIWNLSPLLHGPQGISALVPESSWGIHGPVSIRESHTTYYRYTLAADGDERYHSQVLEKPYRVALPNALVRSPQALRSAATDP